MNYKLLLEQGFNELQNRDDGGEPRSRLQYLAAHIFDFTTYDDEKDELFASWAVKVCDAITNQTTFDMCRESESYTWYLLMCNMPFFAKRIDWGTSIRGAWWVSDGADFRSYGLWIDGKQLYEPVAFTHDDWVAFMKAVVEFASE